MMDGVGLHEVVIESPIHNQILPLMEDNLHGGFKTTRKGSQDNVIQALFQAERR
jgi:hypothetical protein